jgi:hypothetical protein
MAHVALIAGDHAIAVLAALSAGVCAVMAAHTVVGKTCVIGRGWNPPQR